MPGRLPCLGCLVFRDGTDPAGQRGGDDAMVSRGESAVAIVGIGATEQGEIPGQSANEIAVRAAKLALEDAGMTKADIDGLVTCPPPFSADRSGLDEDIGFMLGINPRFSSTLAYGACAFSLHLGAMAIQAGLASTILLTFGTNPRSQKTSAAVPIGGGAEWTSLAGLVHVAGPAAMAARRYMHLYGTTESQLGSVAVAQREWASANPLAIFREPITIDDYLSAPYIVAPLRRLDLTMLSDGGVAVVLTTAERASSWRSAPVYVLSMAQQSALRGDQNDEKLLRPWIREVARRVYEG